MKQFFKFFTASCLGTLAALVLIILVFTIFGSYSAAQAKKISSNSILEIDFIKQIPEKSNNVVSGDFDFDGEDYPGLRTIRRALAHAQEDPKIKGIVLSSKSVPVGQATLFELHDALLKFKDSGKFIYAYEDYYSQSAYLLASTADSIFLNPNGLVELKGYGALIPFFKPLMDKVGFKFDIYYAGKFKSATEPFRRESMSPENKFQTREYLDDLFEMFAQKISQNRGISQTSLNTIVNEFEGRNAEKCIENKLIDKIAYHNEFVDFLKNKLEIKSTKKLKTIDLEDYISKITLSSGSAKDKVAIVFAEGDILYNTNAKGQVDDLRYLKTFDRIKRDEKIKAVVLRVNSPGGSALTSDIIWSEIEELKSKGIPVVTSMGDYAASGGYYIACNSDSILAASNTLTGSIGVFSMLPNMKKLFNDKVGIMFDTVKTHDLSLMNNFVYDPNSRENIIMQEGTDDLYSKFLGRVADGRNMTKDQVHEIAQGRVWSGSKALDLGLVDKIGSLDDAIEIAANMAEIEEYKLSEYPKIKENPFKAIMKAFEDSNASIYSHPLKNNAKAKALYKDFQSLELMMQLDQPLARMPFQIEAY